MFSVVRPLNYTWQHPLRSATESLLREILMEEKDRYVNSAKEYVHTWITSDPSISTAPWDALGRKRIN